MATRASHAVTQRAHRHALDRLSQAQKTSSQRTHLRIERRAVRLLDADNFAGGCKALIDCLRQASLIPDDDPASLEVTFTQTRVPHRREEGTQIEIQSPRH